MLSCRQAAARLSRELEEPLPPRARLGLRWHLLMCRLCRAYGEQLRFLRGACRGAAEPQGSEAALGAQARARIKEALERAM